MPELPEVETIARQLDAVLPGRVFGEIRVYREKSAQSDLAGLVGRKIEGVGRKAKNIIIETSYQKPETRKQPLYLLIHLKMTGQLVWRKAKQKIKNQKSKIKIMESAEVDGYNLGNQVIGGHPTLDWVNELPSKHTRIEAVFSDGSKLFFNDQRVFGWWKVVNNDQLQMLNDKRPPDVVDPEFTVEYLTKVLKKSQRAVKLVLLDQSKIGGLGNIYVCDALWKAGAKPTRRATTLKHREIARLHRACVEVIERGIELGGASERSYKHINGMGGKYQEEFLVYKREGNKCLRPGCVGMIKKAKLGGRGTYFCPVCQK